MTPESILKYSDLLDFFRKGDCTRKVIDNTSGSGVSVSGYVRQGDFQLLIIISCGPRGGVKSLVIVGDSTIVPDCDALKYGSSVSDAKIRIDPKNSIKIKSVSYTHLTLPTKRIV